LLTWRTCTVLRLGHESAKFKLNLRYMLPLAVWSWNWDTLVSPWRMCSCIYQNKNVKQWSCREGK
jgi:hypothetical protein